MCEFRIGQKVVYIGGDGHSGKWNRPYNEKTTRLSHGAIYTVRWVGIERFDRMGDLPSGALPAIKIVEHVRTFSNGHFHDYPFGAMYFRPLVTDDSRYDISVFRRMCVDATKRVSAE